jgi:hypothetical protein
VDQILNELFANHARGQAVNLHLRNRAHISVETILQTAYRRMRQRLTGMKRRISVNSRATSDWECATSVKR